MKPMDKTISKDFLRCPEGQWIARLCGIIDMGTQEETFEGKFLKRPKMYLQFEVFAQNEDGSPSLDDEGRPFLVGRVFTASMSTRGKLLPFVNAWRGKELEDKDFPFDFNRMLGRHGLMSVAHTTSKADATKIFANIVGIAPVPRQMAFGSDGKSILPEAVHPTFFFDMDNPDWASMMKIYDSLWDGIKNKIAASPEFLIRSGGKPQAPAAADPYDEDDIPF